MPVSYRYIDRSDPEREVTLDEIDKLVAEALGEQPSPAVRLYEDLASEVALAILMKGGSNLGPWEPGRAVTVFKKALNKGQEKMQARLSKMCDAVFANFDFQAWR